MRGVRYRSGPAVAVLTLAIFPGSARAQGHGGQGANSPTSMPAMPSASSPDQPMPSMPGMSGRSTPRKPCHPKSQRSRPQRRIPNREVSRHVRGNTRLPSSAWLISSGSRSRTIPRSGRPPLNSRPHSIGRARQGFIPIRSSGTSRIKSARSQNRSRLPAASQSVASRRPATTLGRSSSGSSSRLGSSG